MDPSIRRLTGRALDRRLVLAVLPHVPGDGDHGVPRQLSVAGVLIKRGELRGAGERPHRAGVHVAADWCGPCASRVLYAAGGEPKVALFQTVDPGGAAADGPGARSAARAGDDQAARRGGGAAALDVLPHVPGNGDLAADEPTKAQVRLGPGRDGAPRHVGVRAVPRARHQAGDALQVRRPAGPVAGAGPTPRRRLVT